MASKVEVGTKVEHMSGYTGEKTIGTVIGHEPFWKGDVHIIRTHDGKIIRAQADAIAPVEMLRAEINLGNLEIAIASVNHLLNTLDFGDEDNKPGERLKMNLRLHRSDLHGSIQECRDAIEAHGGEVGDPDYDDGFGPKEPIGDSQYGDEPPDMEHDPVNDVDPEPIVYDPDVSDYSITPV